MTETSLLQLRETIGMSKSKQPGRQQERVLPGSSVARGKTRAAGATGTTGTQRLRRGDTGRKTTSRRDARPDHRRETLRLVQAQLGEVSRELTAQIKRMLGLTAELDALRANVSSLLNTPN